MSLVLVKIKYDMKINKDSSSNSTSGMTRRQTLGVAAAAAGAAIAGIGGYYAYKRSTIKAPVLTSGYIPILDSVPLVVAYDKGFFEEQGIKVEKPRLIRGWPALLEAFESRQILLTHILLPQVIFMRYAREIDVRSVAFNHTNVVAMLKAKGIDTISDLGGKVVGCPTWWAPHTGIFQDVLRKAGLKPVVGKSEGQIAKDEVVFRVVQPPDMPESLKTGAIAGCTVSEPFGAMSELLAEATMVKMSGDVWKEHPCCQSVLLQETIDNDQEWANNVTIALYRAAKWARENREELAEMLGKDGKGYFPMPIKVVKRALIFEDLSYYGAGGTGAIMHPDWNVKRVGFTPYPFKQAFQTTIDLMRRTVVEESVALPPEISKLTGDEIADTIVDYDMAKVGMNAVGGAEAFGLKDSDLSFKKQEYEVLLKDSSEQ